MDERMNKSPPVFYRTSSPSGPLPSFLSPQFTIMQSKATGITDHILPLGDLFSLFPIYKLFVSPSLPHRGVEEINYVNSCQCGVWQWDVGQRGMWLRGVWQYGVWQWVV